MTLNSAAPSMPLRLRALALIGIVWNGFGIVQFVQSVIATRVSLVAMGMTDAQAAVMTSSPLWMTLAFGVGTLGGLAGSLLLLARKRAAAPVLGASLIGYLVLFLGDITEGVFAAIGPGQVGVLSLVVAIAATLLWAARRADRQGLLD